MDENIKREEIARIVGHGDEKEYLKKKVSIVFDNKQFSVRIPAKFATFAKIDPKKDKFEFELIPYVKDGKISYSIEAVLEKGDMVETGKEV